VPWALKNMPISYHMSRTSRVLPCAIERPLGKGEEGAGAELVEGVARVGEVLVQLPHGPPVALEVLLVLRGRLPYLLREKKEEKI